MMYGPTIAVGAIDWQSDASRPIRNCKAWRWNSMTLKCGNHLPYLPAIIKDVRIFKGDGVLSWTEIRVW